MKVWASNSGGIVHDDLDNLLCFYMNSITSLTTRAYLFWEDLKLVNVGNQVSSPILTLTVDLCALSPVSLVLVARLRHTNSHPVWWVPELAAYLL